MVTMMAEKVIEIKIVHLIDFAKGFWAKVVAQKMINELTTLLLFNPQCAELVQSMRFAHHALYHLTTVFIDWDADVPSIATAKDEPAFRTDENALPANFSYSRPIVSITVATWTTTISVPVSVATGARRSGNKVCPESEVTSV